MLGLKCSITCYWNLTIAGSSIAYVPAILLFLTLLSAFFGPSPAPCSPRSRNGDCYNFAQFGDMGTGFGQGVPMFWGRPGLGVGFGRRSWW